VGEIDPARLAEGRVHIRTPDLEHDLRVVMQWQSAHQFPLRRFRAHHASLDQVFHDVLDRSRARSSSVSSARFDREEVR